MESSVQIEMNLDSCLPPVGGEDIRIVGAAQTNLIKCQIACYSYSWSRGPDLFALYLTPLWKIELGREKERRGESVTETVR